MTRELQAVDAAIAACCDTNGGEDEVEELRTLIEPMLIARLTVLSVDRDVIRACLEGAFELFKLNVTHLDINWLSWLTSNALGLLAERTGQVDWLDGLARPPLPGSPAERRALVIGAILTLDPQCQWRLLRLIKQSWGFRVFSFSCQRQLVERLNLSAGPVR